MPRVQSGSNPFPPADPQFESPNSYPAYQPQPPQPTGQTVYYHNQQPGYEQNVVYTQQGPGVVYTQPGMVQINTVMQPGQMIPPGQVVWVAMPEPIPGCPPGLEYLYAMDSLDVKQKKEWLEVFSGFETSNKYVIRDKMGQYVYFAVENSDFCSRQCLGTLRPFDLGVYDNAQRQVMNIHRPYNCTGCCCPCCLQTMQVEAPPGNPIGQIEENWSFCLPRFTIKNRNGEPVLKIEGPCCTSSCCGNDVKFKVVTADGKAEIGEISKKWGGLKEFYTDADTFGITFPLDMDVHVKATLVAACFLIDFMYYEQSGNNNN
ncbi:phospholipid scramblase 2-like [Paramacrobiotus metropolitanus]|uniref:phospholipid scramblase 2-like n=1 Tax=Paramacrobiotus metropolitanus TaxID=2943436 RepID=UPI0024461CB2|nr:phospholipid scramblase 2-like [Paramacrobiotus metropolitanus]XP_055343714.1 phospholipid scramblase 2-like [Paramacrobiotus metropolitanus]